MINMILRRLFKRDFGSIVAPLNRIADDLARLQENNKLDNSLDHKVIARIESQISARTIENVSAHNTETKIRELIG